ncbi:MAG: FAD-dependent monooxygenase [Alphaproteobacteria bacterium]
MSSLPSHADVVIVGAGPVGMTIACLLGRYGVDTLVLDKELDILRHPRAIGTDNDGLRVLQNAGLPRDAFELIAMPRLEMHSPFSGQIMDTALAGHINSHPTLAMFFQPDMEEAIHKTAATYDSVKLLRGMSASDAVEDKDGLTVTLADRDGAAHTVRCRYLVAADGANSHFRKLIGQSFEGKDYAEDWLIVDVQGRDPEKHGPGIDHVMFGCDPARPYPHMPAPGNRERWEFKIRKDEDNDHFLKDDTIRELLLPWYPDGDAQIERKAVYRFQARAVDCFHKGRILLAGDAAHVTPPFAGQGLVSGHRDALNLAWKLAWVLKGKADPAILSSYDSERRPHALATTNLARFIGSIVMPRNKFMAIIIHTLMKYAPRIPVLRKRVGGVEMKPKNQFRHGLFLKKRKDTLLPPGSQFPQLRLFDKDGTPLWSDDIAMGKVRLIGFGVDPAAHLSDDGKNALAALDGEALQICYGSQVFHRATHDRVYEDLDGLAMPQTAPVGWCALVRPDQVVIADGPVETATQMVSDAHQLFTAYERNAA